jgi:hypothetical protein
MPHSAFSSTVPPEVLKCRAAALDIIRDDYPKVKDGILSLETFMRRKSRKAVYELRDFMAHFVIIFTDGVSEEDAKHNLSECRTHLRRCIVEPLEYQAEKGFVKLDRLSRCFGWVLWRTPQTKKDFYHNMVRIQELIARGREVKADGNAANFFREAFELVQDLKADIGPARYIIKGIFWILAIFVAGILTAMAATTWEKVCPAKQASGAPTGEIAPENVSSQLGDLGETHK